MPGKTPGVVEGFVPGETGDVEDEGELSPTDDATEDEDAADAVASDNIAPAGEEEDESEPAAPKDDSPGDKVESSDSEGDMTGDEAPAEEEGEISIETPGESFLSKHICSGMLLYWLCKSISS